MITSPGRKINRYYENLEKKREWDEASNRPLIEETDVVEFFKHLGFQATVYQEKLQSCYCCSEQAAEPEDGRQNLQTLAKAGTGGARGSAEEGEARVSERVCDRGSAKQSRHHSRGDSERGRAGRVRVHRARQGIV